MVNYLNAIKRPFSNFTKLIIGALLSILPIINFFSLGYIFEASRLSMLRKKQLPPWKDWKILFIHGFFFFLISLIWLIPFMIFMGLGISSVLVYSKIVAGSPFVFSPVLVIFGIAAGLLAWFLLPIALMEYILNDKFTSAFKVKTIFKRAFTLKYFVPWIIATLIVVCFAGIGNLIMFVFSFLPVINIILASIIHFAGMIAFYTIIAEAYSYIK